MYWWHCTKGSQSIGNIHNLLKTPEGFLTLLTQIGLVDASRLCFERWLTSCKIMWYCTIIIWATVKMVENYLNIARVFCQRCARNTKKRWPPPKAITWDHIRQSIKLGVNQANTIVHIHRTGKTDKGNSTCGALLPAVTLAFGIQLARSLSFSPPLSLACSLPLSLCRFVANFLRTMSYVGGVIWR